MLHYWIMIIDALMCILMLQLVTVELILFTVYTAGWLVNFPLGINKALSSLILHPNLFVGVSLYSSQITHLE